MGDTNKIRELIIKGANPDVKGSSGLTAIEIADFNGKVDVMKCLLVNVNMVESGLSQLVTAIHRKKATVVRALLEMGVKDQLGEVELFRAMVILACSVSSAAVIDSLVKAGPDHPISISEQLFARVATFSGRVENYRIIRRLAEEERQRLLADVEVCTLQKKGTLYADLIAGVSRW